MLVHMSDMVREEKLATCVLLNSVFRGFCYELLVYLFVALSGSTASHLCLFRNTDTYGVTLAQGSMSSWGSQHGGTVLPCETGVVNIKHSSRGPIYRRLVSNASGLDKVILSPMASRVCH